MGLLLGIGCGIASSLIPGLHVALVLALLLGAGLAKLLGGTATVLFLAAAAGSALYAKRLAMVYHPAAGSDEVASLDAALKLTAKGQGGIALRLMVYATDRALGVVLGVTALLVAFAVAGVNGAKLLDKSIAVLGIPLILLWVGYTVCRSRHRLKTAVAFGLSGAVGYAVLHHPQLVGNAHQLSPLMAGFFAIPITLGMLTTRTQLPPQEAPGHVAVDTQQGFVGGLIGCATGFFAGLGAGSLVSLFQSRCESDEDFLLLSSSAEAGNDMLALLLVLVAGMGRSGEAVLLGRYTGQVEVATGLLVFLAVGIGAVCGRKFVFVQERRYQDVIASKPAALWGVLVLIIAVSQVLLTGAWVVSLSLMIAGASFSLWCRHHHLPLQVSFAALALPLVVQHLGMVPHLNVLIGF